MKARRTASLLQTFKESITKLILDDEEKQELEGKKRWHKLPLKEIFENEDYQLFQ
jgi:hypothetical protein